MVTKREKKTRGGRASNKQICELAVGTQKSQNPTPTRSRMDGWAAGIENNEMNDEKGIKGKKRRST